MKIHPNEETLEELLMFLGKDWEQVIRHLVWCASCRSKLVYLPRPRPVEEAAPTQEIVISEIRQAVLERQTAMQRERDQAPGLFLELLEQPAERRELLVSGDPRFHTWGVFELLVERSLESSLQDTAFGEHLGLLALRLSDQLDPERYGTERVQDLRARASAYSPRSARGADVLPPCRGGREGHGVDDRERGRLPAPGGGESGAAVWGGTLLLT